MGFVLLAILLIFFTCHFITLSCQYLHDIPHLFLIVSTYFDFLLLFWVERKFQNTPLDNVAKRNRLEVAAWVVVSTLFFLLLYQLPVVLPLLVQVVVCVSALAFYFAIFLHYFVLPGDASTATRAPLPPAPEVEMTHVQSAMGSFILLAILLIFFTCHFITLSCQYLHDIPQLFLIVSTYFDFLLLFWVERKFQNTPLDNVAKRNRLEVAAWVVVSTLFFLLLYQLPVVLPLLVQVVVCVSALAFYFAIFLHYFVLPSAPEVEMTHVESIV